MEDLYKENISEFNSKSQASRLTLDLINSAKREICFVGPELDPVLFNSSVTADALLSFLKNSHQSTVRFIVFSKQKRAQSEHQLIPLATKFSSRFLINVANKSHQIKQQYLLVDESSYLVMPEQGVYEGHVEKNAPYATHKLQQEFEKLWHHSQPDINTRSLSI